MSEPFNDYLEDIVEELASPKLWSEISDFESAKNDVVYNLRMCSTSVNNLFADPYSSVIANGTAAHHTRLYINDRYDVMLELFIPSYQKISSFENNDSYVCLDVSDVPYDLPISDQKDLINRHLLKNWLDDIFLKAFDRYINSFRGSKGEYYEFSLPEVERNRLQLDVVRKALILLQALCEAKGLTEIRYYHLMNMALSTHVNKYAITTTLDDVFLMLLAELCDAVENQHLPHYFLGDSNLLSNISCEELYEYESILDRAYSTLSSYVHHGALSYERCRSHFE